MDSLDERGKVVLPFARETITTTTYSGLLEHVLWTSFWLSSLGSFVSIPSWSLYPFIDCFNDLVLGTVHDVSRTVHCRIRTATAHFFMKFNQFKLCYFGVKSQKNLLTT